MSLIDTLMSEIDTAIRSADGTRRHALLASAARLLADHHAELSDHEISVFDEVILSLLDAVEISDRIKLATHIADLVRAPKKTLQALACDDEIGVARPLLLHSPCLDDETLVTIARSKSNAHLLALATRRSLPAHVIEELIARGDLHVLVDIARNENRPLPDKILHRLAEFALNHRPLYRILRSRPDLASRHIGAVIEAARHRARATDLIRHDDENEALTRALAEETAKKIATSQLAFSSPADSVFDKIAINSDVDDLLEREQIDDALLRLANETGLSPDTVKRAFHTPQFEPLMFMLRARDYPLATMLHFMRFKHGRISEEFSAEISNAYRALARDTAKRLAAFMSEQYTTPENDDDQPLRHSA